MSMVKSSRNFGKEFSSQLDYCHRSFKDSCGKDQGWCSMTAFYPIKF